MQNVYLNNILDKLLSNGIKTNCDNSGIESKLTDIEKAIKNSGGGGGGSSEQFHNMIINGIYGYKRSNGLFTPYYPISNELIERLTTNDSHITGTLPASSYFEPWHAFTSERNFNASVNGEYYKCLVDGYLQIEFDELVTIYNIDCAVYFNDYSLDNYVLSYSENGDEWNSVNVYGRLQDGYVSTIQSHVFLENPIHCKYLRFINKSDVNGLGFGAIHLHGLPDSVTN